MACWPGGTSTAAPTWSEQTTGFAPHSAWAALAWAFWLIAALRALGFSGRDGDVARTDLQRHDLSAPGREAIQVRVDLAPGVAFGKHTHPGEEIIYVLEGSLEYEVEGKPHYLVSNPAGAFSQEKANKFCEMMAKVRRRFTSRTISACDTRCASAGEPRMKSMRMPRFFGKRSWV